MSVATQPAQVEIHDVAIDHVNVREPKQSVSAQNLVALTPLLTVLITAFGLVFTFCFNIWQNHTTARQKVDSDWREALAKGINNEPSAAFIALEMQTFANDPVYGSQAKSIMYSALPKIASEVEFDTAFHGAVASTMEDDQDSLVAVVRILSLALEKLHDDALKTDRGAASSDQSLASFVKDPSAFLDDGSKALADANALTWKLDTASGGLSTLWHGEKSRRGLSPGRTDLSGLIFLNHDFRGVDFSRASLVETFFVGSCKVDGPALPKAAIAVCSAN